MIDYVDLYQDLLEAELPILLFVGNMDRNDGPVGIQKWMQKLQWKEMEEFYASPVHTYYYPNDIDGEITIGGNYRQHKNLNYLTLYNAGHLAPSTQLALTRTMMKDMIFEGKLKCHHEESDG